MALLILEMLAGLEVYGFTEILTLLENTGDGGRAPVIRVLDLIYTSLSQAIAETCHMDSGDLHLVML